MARNSELEIELERFRFLEAKDQIVFFELSTMIATYNRLNLPQHNQSKVDILMRILIRLDNLSQLYAADKKALKMLDDVRTDVERAYFKIAQHHSGSDAIRYLDIGGINANQKASYLALAPPIARTAQDIDVSPYYKIKSITSELDSLKIKYSSKDSIESQYDSLLTIMEKEIERLNSIDLIKLKPKNQALKDRLEMLRDFMEFERAKLQPGGINLKLKIILTWIKEQTREINITLIKDPQEMNRQINYLTNLKILAAELELYSALESARITLGDFQGNTDTSLASRIAKQAMTLLWQAHAKAVALFNVLPATHKDKLEVRYFIAKIELRQAILHVDSLSPEANAVKRHQALMHVRNKAIDCLRYIPNGSEHQEEKDNLSRLITKLNDEIKVLKSNHAEVQSYYDEQEKVGRVFRDIMTQNRSELCDAMVQIKSRWRHDQSHENARIPIGDNINLVGIAMGNNAIFKLEIEGTSIIIKMVEVDAKAAPVLNSVSDIGFYSGVDRYFNSQFCQFQFHNVPSDVLNSTAQFNCVVEESLFSLGDYMRSLTDDDRLKKGFELARHFLTMISEFDRSGIIFPDIKPENLMIRGNNVAELMIADRKNIRHFSGSEQHDFGDCASSINYLPNEFTSQSLTASFCSARKDLVSASDISKLHSYQTGVSLYLLVTNTNIHEFNRLRGKDELWNHPLFKQAPEGVRLREVLSRLVDAQAKHRYTADEALEALSSGVNLSHTAKDDYAGYRKDYENFTKPGAINATNGTELSKGKIDDQSNSNNDGNVVPPPRI